jgi:WD40 repeat protein
LLEVDPKTIATYSHQYITVFEKSTGKHLKNVPMSGFTKVIKVDHAILAFACRQTAPNTLRLLPWTEEKSTGKTIQAHDLTILDCAITPQKNVVTVTDNEIKLWHSTGEHIKTVPIHGDPILLTPLSETFIATGSDKRIDIWSTENRTLQKTVNLEKHLENDDPLSALIALDEETLIIPSNDHVGMVKWRQENPVSIMTKLQKPIKAIALLPLANALAIGYEDGIIELYSSETLTFIKSFKATGSIINLIALAEGLQCASLASCHAQGQNEAIQIWE